MLGSERSECGGVEVHHLKTYPVHEMLDSVTPHTFAHGSKSFKSCPTSNLSSSPVHLQYALYINSTAVTRPRLSGCMLGPPYSQPFNLEQQSTSWGLPLITKTIIVVGSCCKVLFCAQSWLQPQLGSAARQHRDQRKNPTTNFQIHFLYVTYNF